MVSPEKKIEILSKQCETIDSKITSFELLGLRVVTLGTTVVIGLLALSIKEKSDIALVILPFAMYALLFYWINVTTWILSFGGYKKHLEERINSLAGEPLLLWECRIIHSQHVNVPNTILRVLCSVVLFSCIVASIYGACRIGEFLFIVVLICVNILSLTALGIALRYMKNEFRRTYREAQSCFSDYGNITGDDNS